MKHSSAHVRLVAALMVALLWPCRSIAVVPVGDYTLLMSARGHEITGLCILSTADGAGEDAIVGTVVNEFGVKAFDITYSGGKAKVKNVIGPMNRWYIRRVLSRDWSFIIRHLAGRQPMVEGKREMQVTAEGDVVVTNHRFRISYTLTPMKQAAATKPAA